MPEIKINIATQTLIVSSANTSDRLYRISTSLRGAGQKTGSGMTPLGQHIIRAKIGQNQPIYSVFTGRRPTGEIYEKGMMGKFPGRDWILSRILWLSGCELGFNRSADVDTMRRYIYIHGTPYEEQLGQAVSHGCIRMSNTDVIELFDLVDVGCCVVISNG